MSEKLKSVEESKKYKTREDWEKELKQALITGHFPLHCFQSSQNFGFCAVGIRLQKEQPDIANSFANQEGKYIPQRIMTKEAWDLGMKFHQSISLDKVGEANKLFNQIQSLPRVLKNEAELKEYDSNLLNRIMDKIL